MHDLYSQKKRLKDEIQKSEQGLNDLKFNSFDFKNENLNFERNTVPAYEEKPLGLSLKLEIEKEKEKQAAAAEKDQKLNESVESIKIEEPIQETVNVSKPSLPVYKSDYQASNCQLDKIFFKILIKYF